MNKRLACTIKHFSNMFMRLILLVFLLWWYKNYACVNFGQQDECALTSSTSRYHSFSFIFEWERWHCELICLLIEQIWQHRVLKHDKWNCDRVCSFVYLFSHWQQHNQFQPPWGAFSLLRAPQGKYIVSQAGWGFSSSLIRSSGFLWSWSFVRILPKLLFGRGQWH